MDKWIGENIFSTKKETVDVVNGSAALRLKTVSFQGQTIPGLTILGEYNPLKAGSLFGISFSGRPDTLHVIYKYTAQNDTAAFAFRLSSFGTFSETVMNLSGRVSGDDEWTYLSLPLSGNYMSESEPDSLIVLAISSVNADIAKVGSTLIIDGIYFSYQGSVSTIEGVKMEQIAGKLYPSSASEYIYFSSFEDLPDAKWLVFDSNGKFKLTGKIDKKLEVNINELTTGAYSFLIIDLNGNLIYRNKFIKI